VSGLRYNEGKRKWSLVPWNALEEVVKVLEQGATKYAPFNWQKGLSWTETYESLQRHAVSWISGEDKDKESGNHHMAHVAVNALFLLWFWLTEKGTDDRYKDNNNNKEDDVDRQRKAIARSFWEASRNTNGWHALEHSGVFSSEEDLC
jgi:hypothetical protein